MIWLISRDANLSSGYLFSLFATEVAYMVIKKGNRKFRLPFLTLE
jgi:hypothetical protein